MRMQHWSKWVMALLVNAACVASAPAQDYPFDVAQEEDIYQTSAGEETPQTQPELVGEAGYYPGYSNEYGAYPVQPWPEVSPYDYSVDQTYVGDDGLWYRRTNRRQTQFYIGADYFDAAIKRPKSGNKGGFVGAADANQLSVYNWVAREYLDLNLNKESIVAAPSVEEFGSNESRPGVIIRLGQIFADDSSWELSGFYAASKEQNAFFSEGALNRETDNFSSVDEQSYFSNTVFFPPMGMPPPIFTLADQIPDYGRLVYDEGVQLIFDSKAWGSQLEYFTTPIYSDAGLGQFNASFGVRYLGIWEQFGFIGSDSGRTTNQVANTAGFRGIPGQFFQVSPFTTTINSYLESHLVGPQVGLKWSIGGKKLKLTTQVKGAITANFEDRRLETTGYGLEPTLQSRLFRGDPRDGSESESSVNVAPVLEASFIAEIPVMQLPVLNKVPGFRAGQFRIGYNFTQAWRINRAAGSINYTNPLPRISTYRDTWNVGGMVAGFTWMR